MLSKYTLLSEGGRYRMTCRPTWFLYCGDNILKKILSSLSFSRICFATCGEDREYRFVHQSYRAEGYKILRNIDLSIRATGLELPSHPLFQILNIRYESFSLYSLERIDIIFIPR